MFYFAFRSICTIFAIKDGEITPSRQKKKRVFFVLLSTFRNFADEMATKKLKHRYVQGFGIVVMVLALARCVFPGIAGEQGAVSVAPEDSTVLNTETAMAEKADSTLAEKAEEGT